MGKKIKKPEWSADVDETSRAALLPEGLFTQSAGEIAEGLKKVVLEDPTAKERSPLQSAMGMLDFYINRAGKNLKPEDRARLDAAKEKLRKLFGEE